MTGITIGVDEAGRGALAGPVVAAAVVLPPNYDIPFLSDSKALSATQREVAYDAIMQQATHVSVAQQSPIQIDRLNILNATLAAMKAAVEAIPLSVSEVSEVIIDGNKRPTGMPYPVTTKVKADRDIPSVCAASIVAKVTRDRQMKDYHNRFAEYGFNTHFGYGTQTHYDALFRHGPCDIHRRSFNLTRQERLFADVDKKRT